MQPDKYIRKPFEIDAMRVTEDNMTWIANWCDGTIENQGTGGDLFIKVAVHAPQDERQTQAFVGDWVLKSGRGFKVYTDKAFNNSFELRGLPKEQNVFQAINVQHSAGRGFGGGGGNPGGSSGHAFGGGGSAFPHVK